MTPSPLRGEGDSRLGVSGVFCVPRYIVATHPIPLIPSEVEGRTTPTQGFR